MKEGVGRDSAGRRKRGRRKGKKLVVENNMCSDLWLLVTKTQLSQSSSSIAKSDEFLLSE